MKILKPLILGIILTFSHEIIGQTLPDGTYSFDIAFAEWDGKSLGSTCTIIIKGDSVTVVNDGTLSGIKGEVIDSGILVKHKSGKWIISNSEEDKLADEIGGCSEGPLEIDIENRKLWLC